MLTILISLVLVAATIASHYETLRYTSARITHMLMMLGLQTRGTMSGDSKSQGETRPEMIDFLSCSHGPFPAAC